MPTLHYEVVDVFTETPFAGNPLAVVLDADDVSDAGLQALAREFHLSETAFPLQPGPGADYRLRIFTPETELPFAGHPSVGAAWVLTWLGRLAPGRRVQECGAGLLPVDVEPGPGRVELTGGAPQVGPKLDPAPLLAAVGLTADDLAGPPPRVCGTGNSFSYLPVAPEAVAKAAPDPGRLRALAAVGLGTGLSVSAWDPATRSAHTRVFAADIGVPEDPATGSAATGYGAWLAASGLVDPDGETAYVIFQGAELQRPSRLDGTVVTKGGRPVQCRVAGRVVPVARGEIARP